VLALRPKIRAPIANAQRRESRCKLFFIQSPFVTPVLFLSIVKNHRTLVHVGLGRGDRPKRRELIKASSREQRTHPLPPARLVTARVTAQGSRIRLGITQA